MPRLGATDNIFAALNPSAIRRMNSNKRVCSLPGCTVEFFHPGQYCTKEHFLEHQAQLKGRSIL
jgi:hypothetical protein